MSESEVLVTELEGLAARCHQAAARSLDLNAEDERNNAARTLRHLARTTTDAPPSLDVARTFADAAEKVLAAWDRVDMDDVYASRSARRDAKESRPSFAVVDDWESYERRNADARAAVTERDETLEALARDRADAAHVADLVADLVELDAPPRLIDQLGKVGPLPDRFVARRLTVTDDGQVIADQVVPLHRRPVPFYRADAAPF